MIFEALQKNLYAEIEYPSQLRDLIGTADPWRQFCDLPLELKQMFVYPEHEEAVTDPGYKRRSRANGREDKEYFHYVAGNPGFLDYYQLNNLVCTSPEFESFFDYAQMVHEQATRLAMVVGHELAQQIPGFDHILDASQDSTVLRLLHYDPQTITEQILADRHFDRSGFTLHLYETHDGLQVLTKKMQWQDVRVPTGKTTVLAGYQLEGLTKGDIQNTWHQVARVGDQNGPIGSRYAMVLFVPLVGGPNYDPKYRAQDQEPGYNKRVWD